MQTKTPTKKSSTKSNIPLTTTGPFRDIDCAVAVVFNNIGCTIFWLIATITHEIIRGARVTLVVVVENSHVC